ncbi:MAG: basic amino acid ABC transporter substrate-binding protein [Desulfovibrionaceae bacterium]|nr:basic amino acid ABC transporter substrate-binding protein [Desulfovibrionaceae bacterium]
MEDETLNGFFAKLVLFFFALFCVSGNAMAAEKYIVASDCTWPPFELLDEAKKPVGYSIDFLRAVAKAAGFEVENRNVAWDGIFGGVRTGQYDIVASSTTITEERKLQFDFSDPYFEIVQAVIMPKGKTIKSLKDLKGLRVGGQIATTGIFVVKNANVGATIKEYDDVGLAIQDLVAGRIDAVVCDDPVAKYYSLKKKDYEGKIAVVFQTNDKEYFGFTVKKGRKDLIEKLNRGIKIVKENGTEAALKKKWIGE